MAEVRAAALGEFPAPPPCPTWCETDHTTDFRSLATWIRPHQVTRSVDVPEGCVTMHVTFTDRCWGAKWERRDAPELSVCPWPGHYVNASRPADVAALVKLVGLISPEVRESIQAAALLVSSPEVTPAGEDQ
jgi:hypothetical protein